MITNPSPSGASVNGVMIPCCLTDLDQLGHLLLAELSARVEPLARLDLPQRHHRHGRGRCHQRSPPSVSSSSARSLSGRGSVARSNRASAWLRPAVWRVGWTWSTYAVTA